MFLLLPPSIVVYCFWLFMHMSLAPRVTTRCLFYSPKWALYALPLLFRPSCSSQHHGFLFGSLRLQRPSACASGWGIYISLFIFSYVKKMNGSSVFVLFNTFYCCTGPGAPSGHGVPQRREGESGSSHLSAHVLCLSLPEEPQVTSEQGCLEY